MSRNRVQIGTLEVDAVTFDEALQSITELVERGNGGVVFTPNVDHIVKAEKSAELRRAYARADLALPDGMPLLWASRFLGSPLPAKVSGSDLVRPLARLSAERGWRVYLYGAEPDVARLAAAVLSRDFGVHIVGTESPRVRADGNVDQPEETVRRLRAATPQLVLVALGAPKQELWIDRFAAELSPAVAIGVGGSLDFIAGRIRRAPPLVSRLGLEWLFRLIQEPRRMWRRYLVEDPRFVAIVIRTRRRGGRES